MKNRIGILLCVLAASACGILDAYLNLNDHPYFPSAQDLADYYQLDFDLEQGHEESYLVNLGNHYLLEYAYTSDDVPENPFYLEYNFLVEKGGGAGAAQDYMNETIDLIYQKYIDPLWEEHMLHKINLGQDEFYGREFYYEGRVMASFLSLRFNNLAITMRINANEDQLPGLYHEFLIPYVEEIKRLSHLEW